MPREEQQQEREWWKRSLGEHRRLLTLQHDDVSIGSKRFDISKAKGPSPIYSPISETSQPRIRSAPVVEGMKIRTMYFTDRYSSHLSQYLYTGWEIESTTRYHFSQRQYGGYLANGIYFALAGTLHLKIKRISFPIQFRGRHKSYPTKKKNTVNSSTLPHNLQLQPTNPPNRCWAQLRQLYSTLPRFLPLFAAYL